MDVQKRCHVPYYDKRILLADLPDGQRNPDTHAFRYYSLDAVHVPNPEQPAAGEEIVVLVVRPSWNERYEARLARKQARVVNKAHAFRADNCEDSEGKLHSDQL